MAELITSPTRQEHQTRAYRPGCHSRNVHRSSWEAVPDLTFRYLRAIFLLAGLAALGFCVWNAGRQYVYQTIQNTAFERELKSAAGRAAATSGNAGGPEPRPGEVLGRLSIPRLQLSAIVREGVDAQTLSLAAGHVPHTSLAGQAGNFVVAAHRDTLFRSLKDIRPNDIVTFRSMDGFTRYQVFATEIVSPDDIRVLRPDGGLANAARGSPLLTMITCYPFYYVGAAPQRFIVQARLLPGNEGAIDSKSPLPRYSGSADLSRSTGHSGASGHPS